MKALFTFVLFAIAAGGNATPVSNINAVYHDGQVFVTWDTVYFWTGVVYTLYRSPNPIQHGYQLSPAQNLGNVRDNSALNQRLTSILGTSKYLKIDSSSQPLASNKGLFVATSTAAGPFYYAVTTSILDMEDTTIVFGSNSLTSPINESVVMPRPIWQQNATFGLRTYEIYVQFATKVTSSIYPQMTNAGSFPFNFAIVKSGTLSPHPVTFGMHPGGGAFLSDQIRTMGHPNEWIITIDDWLPNWQQTNFYGYHEDYDIYSYSNSIPETGTIYNYTAQRVAHTVNWAFHNLPIDTTRTYMSGWSMGAIGALFNALMNPTKIAAILIYAPLCNMAAYGGGDWVRQVGSSGTNLPTNEGYLRNERLDAKILLAIKHYVTLPLVFTFCGRMDGAVGWSEKIPFYHALDSNQHGGFHFWTMSDHGQVFFSSPWVSTFPNFAFFTRYRTNLSYPAFSRCSINDDPGDGSPSTGDTLGSINGHLDWNDNIVDVANSWEITLKLRDLSTIYGPDIAPDSATTDVTLRRLQAFSVPLGYRINWENRRNNIVVQQASFVYDSGLITIPAVKVYKDSSRITVTYAPVSVAEQKALPREFTLLQNYPNPFNPSTTISYQLPTRSHVTLKIYDVLGREVVKLVDAVEAPGFKSVKYDGNILASGVYLYQLRAGTFVGTKRFLLLR